MAYALGQHALAVHPFGAAHRVGAAFEFGEKLAYAACSACRVGLHGVAELPEAVFHIVEVGNALFQLGVDVDEHCLKLAESLAGCTG